MENRQITLPQEQWERLIDILGYSTHPDASYLGRRLSEKLAYGDKETEVTQIKK